MNARRSSGRTALIAGASGLVGGECLRRLLASDDYRHVVVLTRRDLGAAVAGSARARQVLCDFSRLDEVAG